MMTSYPNYYAILDIAPESDPLSVRRAYRHKMLHARKHPDLGGDNGEASVINEAYAVLRDPARRSAYDRLFLDHVIEIPAPADVVVPADNRRRTIRYAYRGQVQLRPDHGPDLHPGQCRDVSLGGLSVRTLAPFTVGNDIGIILLDDPGLLLESMVRWRRVIPQRFGEPIFELGLEFSPLDSDRFARFCERVGIVVQE